MALLAYQASGAGGCGKWVVRETTDYLDDPLFEDAVKSSTGPNATVNAIGSAKQSEEIELAPDSEAQLPKKNTPVIDLAGKWKVILNKDSLESKKRSALDLILIQSGDRLQGYGTLAEKGSDIPATATGTISLDGISLDVKLTKQKKDYRLDLAQINSTLEGSYELYSEENLAEKGNATAKRSGPGA